MHSFSRWLCYAGILMLPAFVGAARASTLVFSNLGSPPAFDPEDGWTVDGGVAGGQMLAVAFTSAIGVTFEDAQLPLGIIVSNLSTSPLGVYLASNANGAPGADLANLSLAAGQTVGGWPPGNLVTYGCGVCPALHAGIEYWLVVDIPNLNQDYFASQAAWNWNTTQDYASGANFAFNDTQFGTGWQYLAGQPRPAFEIDGIATPEPGLIGLVAVGLALLALNFRRASRRLHHS
jgi:hypothetical protein